MVVQPIFFPLATDGTYTRNPIWLSTKEDKNALWTIQFEDSRFIISEDSCRYVQCHTANKKNCVWRTAVLWLHFCAQIHALLLMHKLSYQLSLLQQGTGSSYINRNRTCEHLSSLVNANVEENRVTSKCHWYVFLIEIVQITIWPVQMFEYSLVLWHYWYIIRKSQAVSLWVIWMYFCTECI